MPTPNSLDLFRMAGVNIRENPPSPEDLGRVDEMLLRVQHDPSSLVVDVLKAKRACAAATEAAEEINGLLHSMVQGHSMLCHLRTVRDTLDGPRAICRLGNHLQELAVHPEVDPASLAGLKSWEYVAVHENVVVSTWRDDPVLFTMAQGEVVQFKNFADRDSHMVEISRNGHEDDIVVLDESLWDKELTPHSRLVLQRDDPSQAIALAATEQTQSKFEVPIENIGLRLEDLAGVEEIAERLIEDIIMRLVRTDIRDEFDLQAIRGILLYSYKPGMGKSKFVSAIAAWFHDHSDVLGYDVVFYEVKPNELKSMWHGEDARIVREDLWGRIRARQAQPRKRPLLQMVVLDEIDAIGRRGGGNEAVFSAAQSDALEAMLVEMDGLARPKDDDNATAHVLCFGMTNRPDRVDDAAKRPGRFGDLVLAMPDVTIEGAEGVMEIYTRSPSLPWYLGGEVETNVDDETIRRQILRPALASVFNTVVLRYKTDTQRSVDVTAGEIMANVHFMDAVNNAKKRAAGRRWRNSGVPAIGYDDVVDCLLDSALSVARQMEADSQMLIRHLQVKLPVTRVDAIDKHELADHRYLSVHSN